MIDEHYKISKITSNDVELHVVEAGDPSNPGILFLHGFPDDHQVWSHQFEALQKNFHVIVFDLRGVSQSSWSASRSGYRIERVLPDISAVIDATRGPEGQVHLVGHDWGSVLGWSFVFHEHYNHRVLSWTSISGPHLGLMLSQVTESLTSFSFEKLKKTFSQAIHSWYVYTMFIPGIWKVILSPLGIKRFHYMVYGDSVPRKDEMWRASRETIIGRVINPLGLYRQNVPRPPAPPKKHSCDVPTQLIIPTEDRFIRPQVFDNLEEYVNNLTRKEVTSGHWVQRSHPELITSSIQQFVNAV